MIIGNKGTGEYGKPADGSETPPSRVRRTWESGRMEEWNIGKHEIQ